MLLQEDIKVQQSNFHAHKMVTIVVCCSSWQDGCQEESHD